MSLVTLIEELIDRKLGSQMSTKLSYCTLKSVSPLIFVPEDNPNIKIQGSFLVVPKYKVFTSRDIGKKFVLASNHDGQTYFYMYEPSDPQGSNGMPYKWAGDIKCNIKGTCPDGPVVVTEGTIEVCTHREGVN